MINGLNIVGESHRSWNATHYKTVEKGVKTVEFFNQWKNFKSNGVWKPINLTFVEKDGIFIMKDAPFFVSLPKSINGLAVLENNNEYNIATKKDIKETSLTMSIKAKGTLPVIGRIEIGELIIRNKVLLNVQYVIYPNAYEEGVDLIYYIEHGNAPRLCKLIRFNKMPTKFDYTFELYLSASCDKKTMSIENTKRGFGFKPFTLWDSNGLIHNIKTDFDVISDTKIIMNKKLIADFFNNVTYPLYTDATITFNPDANVETTSVDGYATSSVSPWDTAHNEATGASANDTNASFEARTVDAGSGNYEIRRGFTLFDTSSIPNAAKILVATASIYVNTVTNGDNDGDDWLNCVQSSPASNTAITTADFDQCGAVDNPIEGSTRKDLSTLTTGTYHNFVLNAIARDWVDKTGITKLGWREGHDALDIPVNGDSRVTIITADEGNNIPKLIVNYSGGRGSFFRGMF